MKTIILAFLLALAAPAWSAPGTIVISTTTKHAAALDGQSFHVKVTATSSVTAGTPFTILTFENPAGSGVDAVFSLMNIYADSNGALDVYIGNVSNPTDMLAVQGSNTNTNYASTTPTVQTTQNNSGTSSVVQQGSLVLPILFTKSNAQFVDTFETFIISPGWRLDFQVRMEDPKRPVNIYCHWIETPRP